jgi:uncharacterized protein DUF4403
MNEQGTSVFHLPIKLSKQNIEWTINQLIEGVVYEDSNMDKDNMMIKAVKREAITITFDEKTIQYRVALNIWVKKNIGLATTVEARGDIAVDFSTVYKVNREWQINTETEVSDYEWLKKPKVRVGFFDIPIKSIANKIVERSKNLISESLDLQLANRFNLYKIMTKGWDLLQKPIRVSREYDLWIKVSPGFLSMTPLVIDGDQIQAKVLLKANINAFVGEKPLVQNEVDLPAFNYSNFADEDFSIELPTFIHYKEIEKLAKQYLIGKTFTSKRRSITVEDISIRGLEEKVLFILRLTGSYNGIINVLGKPVFDKNNTMLEFEEFEFELETKNVLLQSLGWLFYKRLNRKLKETIRFPIKGMLVELRRRIEDELTNYKINNNFFLSGEIGEIELLKISVSAKWVELLFLTKGKATLGFKK